MKLRTLGPLRPFSNAAAKSTGMRLARYYMEQESLEESEALELSANVRRWLAERGKPIEQSVSDMIDRHKPLAYVLGDQPFYPLEQPLLVEPPVLIPRPETEEWVNALADEVLAFGDHVPSDVRVLDLCTGTGCIALALARRLADVATETVAVDFNPLAVDLARRNASRNKLAPSTKIIEANVFEDSILSSLGPRTFSLVVSNPPYITLDDYERLPATVREWEDKAALYGQTADGLAFFRRIVSLVPGVATPGSNLPSGWPLLTFEIGYNQKKAVSELVHSLGLIPDTKSDAFGKDRVVIGRVA